MLTRGNKYCKSFKKCKIYLNEGEYIVIVKISILEQSNLTFTRTHTSEEKKMPGLILNHKMPFFLAFCLIYKTFGLSEFKSERKQKYTNYNSFIEILML